MNYAGIQFIAPIKWALDELHRDCRPKNRMETTVRAPARDTHRAPERSGEE